MSSSDIYTNCLSILELVVPENKFNGIADKANADVIKILETTVMTNSVHLQYFIDNDAKFKKHHDVYLETNDKTDLLLWISEGSYTVHKDGTLYSYGIGSRKWVAPEPQSKHAYFVRYSDL